MIILPLTQVLPFMIPVRTITGTFIHQHNLKMQLSSSPVVNVWSEFIYFYLIPI